MTRQDAWAEARKTSLRLAGEIHQLASDLRVKTEELRRGLEEDDERESED